VLGFEVIPLQETNKWPREDDETPRLVIVNPLLSPVDGPSSEFIRGLLFERKPPVNHRAAPRRSKSAKPRKKRRTGK